MDQTDQIRPEVLELNSNIMTSIKITKSKFKKIIKFINKNSEINIKLSSEIKTHLKYLIELWNNKEVNAEYYFKMIEHHLYINGKLENETLKNMWTDYIVNNMNLIRFLIIPIQ